jgi:hypothetical protein
LTIQAQAFGQAATSGEFDDDDAALIGICGDFASAGERCVALSKVWNEQRTRNGGRGKVVDTKNRSNAHGKGKGVERSWMEEDYNKACATLAYKSIEMSDLSSGGQPTFLTQ